jgi:peptidylprolyl isomerase
LIAGAARALCLALLAVLGGLALSPNARAAEPGRVALVIGNAAYAADGWALANPREDATAIARALEKAGFEVELVLDADNAAMSAAIRRFGGRVAAAGPQGVGFFYFSGQSVRSGGLVVSFAGMSSGTPSIVRLLPVDAQADEVDNGDKIPRLDLLISYMAPLGNGRGFVVVDACQANPLATANPVSSACLAPSPPWPLSQPTEAPLVAYPAERIVEPGSESRYAQALTAALGARGLTARDVFDQAAARVRSETAGGQRPRVEAPLEPGRLLYLSGAPSEADYGARVAESVRWDYARRIGTTNAYRDYLTAYPRGRFVGLAFSRIEALAPVIPRDDSAPAAAEPSGASGDAPEPDADLISAIKAGPLPPLEPPPPSAYRRPDPEDLLLLETTKGRIDIEMIPEIAPVGVARVRELTRQGTLDGAPFRRVVDGFRAELSVPPLDQQLPEVDALPRDLVTPPRITPTTIEVADSDRNRLGVYAEGDVTFGLYKGLPMATHEVAAGAETWATHCPGVASLSQDEDGAAIFIMRGEAPGLDGAAQPWGRVIAGLDVIYDLAINDPPMPDFEPDRIRAAYIAADLEDGQTIGDSQNPDQYDSDAEPGVLDETQPALADMLASMREKLGRAPRVCEARAPTGSPPPPSAAAAR